MSPQKKRTFKLLSYMAISGWFYLLLIYVIEIARIIKELEYNYNSIPSIAILGIAATGFSLLLLFCNGINRILLLKYLKPDNTDKPLMILFQTLYITSIAAIIFMTAMAAMLLVSTIINYQQNAQTSTEESVNSIAIPLLVSLEIYLLTSQSKLKKALRSKEQEHLHNFLRED